MSSDPSQPSTISLDGTPIEYTVRRSDRATRARVTVDLSGVEVVLPEASTRDPECVLAAKADWLRETERTWAARRERIPERRFEAGATFPYLGAERAVVVESRRDHRLTDDAFRLRRSAVERASVQTCLESLYRDAARAEYTERLDRWSERMGLAYDRLQIRNQRTRWGSCSSRGTISMNWRVVMAPERIVDYLVVHELAHLEVADHGADFWRLVGEYDPEWRAHREWLVENGVELVFDEGNL